MSTSTVAVKPALTVNDSKEAMLQRINELTAKVEKKSKLEHAVKLPYGKATVSIIVSDKGGISFYGFGRFPLTVYKQVALFILNNADVIRKFIVDHDAELSDGKNDK